MDAAELKKLGEQIDQRIEKANEQARLAGDEAKKVDASLREELKNLGIKHQEEFDKLKKEKEKQQEQLDDLEKKAGKLNAAQPQVITMGTALKSIFEKDPQFKAYKERQTRAISVNLPAELDLFSKAATMTTSGSLVQTTQQIIAPTAVAGVIFQPDRRVHMRQLLPVGTTSSNNVSYVEETAISNGVAVVAEGATKPQSDFTLTGKRAPVTKIATYLRITEELLEDLPGLTSYITNRFTTKLILEEDRQILTGSGVGANLTGIITAASSYVDVLGMTTVNRVDILVAAITQIAVSEYGADYILVHPRDYMYMALAKSTTGEYLFPGALTGAPMSIMGVPIVSSTLVAIDTFLVGDFAMGAMIFDRAQASVRFYDQDQDNAIKNLVTIVIEERLALPIFRPTAFVTGSFNAGLANGSA